MYYLVFLYFVLALIIMIALISLALYLTYYKVFQNNIDENVVNYSYFFEIIINKLNNLLNLLIQNEKVFSNPWKFWDVFPFLREEDRINYSLDIFSLFNFIYDIVNLIHKNILINFEINIENKLLTPTEENNF